MKKAEKRHKKRLFLAILWLFLKILHFFCIFLRKNLHISKKKCTFAPSFENEDKKHGMFERVKRKQTTKLKVSFFNCCFMQTSVLFSQLLAVASACPEGYTVNFHDLAPVQHGFAVAVAATQNSFGPEGLQRVIEYVQANAPRVNAFGGWYNSENGQFYFDATIVVETEAEAEALARENGQIAYFNLNTCTEVRL